MKQPDKKFYSAQDLIKASGWKLGIKMFNYLRYHIRLFPEPIKYSKGRGLKAVYPHFVLEYFKKIIKARDKGTSFKAIREVLAKDREEVEEQCDYIRRQVKLDREVRAEFGSQLKKKSLSGEVTGSKSDVLEINVHSDVKVEDSADVKIEELIRDLKICFPSWDGASMEALSKIRRKIDALESLKARERVLDTIKATV
jgi:hypothetical protein